MSISDRDRKILWAKAGNRCSKCKQPLVQPGDAEDSTDHAVVGEECDVISPKLDGPRGHLAIVGDLDGYGNLILLCPSDHTIIDQLPKDWPPSRLHKMKAEHEAWVDRQLSPPRPMPRFGVQRQPPPPLVELVKAAELLAVAMGAQESSIDHETLTSDEDVELVAGFFQNLSDDIDMWDDYEPGDRIRAQHELGRRIAELHKKGWRLFGARGRGTLSGIDSRTEVWETAYLRIVRADSPHIVKVAPQPAPQPPSAEAPDLRVNPLLGREPMYNHVTRKPTGQTADLVWLNVKNHAQRALGDAINVWGVINFSKFEMSPARWRDSDDPNLVADMGEIADRKTVRAGQTRQLDVAYRIDGQRTGYGLNTEGMQPQYGWRRPGWELEPGEHVAAIRLTADNAPTAYYRLVLYLPETGPFEIRGFEAIGERWSRS